MWKVCLQEKDPNLFLQNTNLTFCGAIHLRMMGNRCEVFNAMDIAMSCESIINKLMSVIQLNTTNVVIVLGHTHVVKRN